MDKEKEEKEKEITKKKWNQLYNSYIPFPWSSTSTDGFVCLKSYNGIGVTPMG
jgi:hypothetical protein